MIGNWSQEKYINALRFAAEQHNNQKFPGTDWPYLVHLSFVSMEVISALNAEPDADGDLAVQCALLHDSIEDTETTYEELIEKFNKNVADGVMALTKNGEIPDKKERMYDSLARIKKQPGEIWMVKMADRISNLQPPPVTWNNKKKKDYLEQAVVIYEALKDASGYLAQRLNEKIDGYSSYLA